MMSGIEQGYSWLRLVLEEGDMHSFFPTFNICNYDMVCVELPKTKALPPSLEAVMHQFHNHSTQQSGGSGGDDDAQQHQTDTRLPILRITFMLDNEHRVKKLDDLHALMKFKYDDENDALYTVQQETRRSARDGYSVFDGTIGGCRFKFTRTHHWYASYYTDAEEQTYLSFLMDPMWDPGDDDSGESLAHTVLYSSSSSCSPPTPASQALSTAHRAMSYVIDGSHAGYSWMRLVLEEGDMHSFLPEFDIEEYDMVCVSVPKTNAVPPSLEAVMEQFLLLQEPVLPQGGGDDDGAQHTRRRPMLRVTFALHNQHRDRKVDDLHKLVKFKYDDDAHAQTTVQEETRRSRADGYPVYDGSIQGCPFKFTRTYVWYASYYTDAGEQAYFPFLTNPRWDMEDETIDQDAAAARV